MASKNLLFLVILSLISSTLQDVTDNKVDSQDENPFADVAKEILKEKNLENIGGVVNSFLQNGGAKQVMDGVLKNFANGENSGQLLESLGSLLNSGGDEKDGHDTKKSDGDVNPMELISGISSLVGAFQGAGGGAGGEANPAALLQGIGSMLAGGNNQDGGDNTLNLLQGLGSLLGSATQENSQKRGGDDTGANILQGLGSIIGAAIGNQGGGDNNAGALLQGLGSLLGAGNDGQGGINPEMIGNMINMFSNSDSNEKKGKTPSKEITKKASREKLKTAKAGKGSSLGLKDIVSSLATSFLKKSKGKGKNKQGGSENIDLNLILENFPLMLKLAKSFGGSNVKKYLDPIEDVLSLLKDATNEKKEFNFKKLSERIPRIYKAYKELVAPYLKSVTSKTGNEDDSFDFQEILNLATAFLNPGSGPGKATGGFMDYLPMIMNTISAFTGPEAQDRADSHSAHSWLLPPILEKIHVYYDNFLNSDMGKYVLIFIANQPTFKIFQDEKGNFSYNKFESMIENHSFRKHWIQQVVGQLVSLLQVVSDETVYSQYIDMGIMFANSFLQKSGFPKKTFIDPKRPAKSISNFANYAAKKYLGAEVDAKEYVEPVVFYVQDILKMAHKSISPGAQPKELTDKLTDTINMEIIEPITRVNRAFRFSKAQPECDKYVVCVVNQEVTNYFESLPNLKKALYKGSSLIAGWFVSLNTGTPYMELYAIITEDKHCDVEISDDDEDETAEGENGVEEVALDRGALERNATEQEVNIPHVDGENDFYHEMCNGFHEEEIKATTEYVHSEL